MTAEQVAQFAGFFKFALGAKVEVMPAVAGASKTYGRVEGRGVEDVVTSPGVALVYLVRLDGFPLHLTKFAEGSLSAVQGV